MDDRTTAGDPSIIPDDVAGPTPGLVVVYAGGRPVLSPMGIDRQIVVGRGDASGAFDDERMSREHAEIAWDGRRWTVRDLGSRNGTFLDGVQLRKPLTSEAPRVLRLGTTLCLLRQDIRELVGQTVTVSERTVVGPTLREVLDRVARAARSAERLLITGESGSGKELAARTFHASGPFATGPFVAVNCAAIPEGVAERLLFGALKGSYSGATSDVEGYLQAAHGGVLFLDEVGELDLDVQAKLLRVLEVKEVLPLGASTPRRVDTRVCFATNRDLRAAIGQGQFREDLYYRIAQARVHLPPLRDRAEEIPVHVARGLASSGGRLSAHVRFVEECLLRPWPGNVRELLDGLRAAIDRAGAGTVLRPEHLDDETGRPPPGTGAALLASAVSADDPPLAEEDARLRDQLVALLTEHHGNVSHVAKAMGKARMQVQRWLTRLRLDADRFRDP